MPPLARYLLLRLLLLPLTLLVVTFTLMALLTTVRPEVRAFLYLPRRVQEESAEMSNEQLRQATERIIQTHHLEDPFPIQYAYWIVSVFTHGGGYSPSVKGDVFEAILRRTSGHHRADALFLAGLHPAWDCIWPARRLEAGRSPGQALPDNSLYCHQPAALHHRIVPARHFLHGIGLVSSRAFGDRDQPGGPGSRFSALYRLDDDRQPAEPAAGNLRRLGPPPGAAGGHFEPDALGHPGADRAHHDHHRAT